jgi:hypothetical protein
VNGVDLDLFSAIASLTSEHDDAQRALCHGRTELKLDFALLACLLFDWLGVLGCIRVELAVGEMLPINLARLASNAATPMSSCRRRENALAACNIPNFWVTKNMSFLKFFLQSCEACSL